MAVAVVLALVAGSVWVVQERRDRDRLAVGAVQGEYLMTGGNQVSSPSFVLPNAELRILVEVGGAARDTESRDTVRAPRGGVLAKVQVTSRSPAATADRSDRGAATVTLRSGGRDVQVAKAVKPAARDSAGYGSRKATLVALPGDGRDVQVVVEFAGRAQSVDLLSGRRTAGDFAALYPSGSAVGPAADETVRGADRSDPRLTWTATATRGSAQRTPYLPTLGWAGPGTEWMLLTGVGARYAEQPARWVSGDEVAEYRTAGSATTTVTCNGHPARTTLAPGSASSGSGEAAYACRVPSGRAVTVGASTTVTLERSYGSQQAPTKSTMTVQSHFAVRAVVAAPVRGSR